MDLTEGHYEQIAPLFRIQRGNVRVLNLQVPDAVPYIAEHGCK